MAYGNKSNDGLETLYSFRVVTKDGNNKKAPPYFSVSKKNVETGEWENDVDKCSFISGRIDSIFHSETEWEGDILNRVAVYIIDNDEKYKLDLNMNMLSRSLLNSLLNIDKSKPVHISLYENDRGYPSVALRQDDQLVSWKFQQDELPEIPETVFKGKPLRDYSKQEDFFLEQLVESFGMRSSTDRFSQRESSGEETQRANESNEPEEEQPLDEKDQRVTVSDDDVPF